MKRKLILIIIMYIFFLPFIVNAKSCDTDKISISSITVNNKSDSVEELEAATFTGKNINLNLSMSEVGDNIKYKVIIKNESNEDFELDKNSFNINSEYIDYTFESEDNSNEIKANSSKIIFLKAEYKSAVPNELFESGTYNDNKIIALNLSTVDNNQNFLKNPSTGNTYLFLIIILATISVISFIVLKKPKHIKFMILIIGTMITIPISVYALCKFDIKVESNVSIISKPYTGIIYRSNNQEVQKGENINNLEHFTKNKNEINENIYLMHYVNDNIIDLTYICFTLDKEYCLEGTDSEIRNHILTIDSLRPLFIEKNGHCGTVTYSTSDSISCSSDDWNTVRVNAANSDITIYDKNGKGCFISWPASMSNSQYNYSSCNY